MASRANQEGVRASRGDAHGGTTLEELGELLEVAAPPVSNAEAEGLARVRWPRFHGRAAWWASTTAASICAMAMAANMF